MSVECVGCRVSRAPLIVAQVLVAIEYSLVVVFGFGFRVFGFRVFGFRV